MRFKHLKLAVLLVIPFGGCASLVDVHYEHTQKGRARAAWRALPSNAKDHCYPHDYEDGWKDGFYDVATGGKGCPPVVAPHKYWRPSQVLEHCDNRRHAYYDGWQDGAACASRYPDTHFLKLWSSCECPLPVCENQCQTGTCNTGECGMNAFPEAIISDEVIIQDVEIPSSMIESEPAVPAPVAPAPAKVAPAPPKPEPVATPEAEVRNERRHSSLGSNERIQIPVPGMLEADQLAAPTQRPSTVGEPISDSVWLELESEHTFTTKPAPAPRTIATKTAPASESPKLELIPNQPQPRETWKDISGATSIKVAQPIVAREAGLVTEPVVQEATEIKFYD